MKNISYIIKRIIIGVGIALTLAFIRGALISDVSAMEVGAYNIGSHIEVIDNTTDSYTYSISGNPWSSLAGSYGYIIGNVGLYKVSGDSTSINTYFRQVYVNSYNSSYVCDISSPTYSNSTFNGGTFTYKCPVAMTSYGITSLVFQFSNIQANSTSTYRLVIGSLMTFEIHNNQDINVDISGTTSAINNQITNDNQNTQDIIDSQEEQTQEIIDNQNENTEKEIESQQVCSTFELSKANVSIDNKALNLQGVIVDNSSYIITRYFEIVDSTTIKVLQMHPTSYSSCFYNENKEVITCVRGQDLTNESFLTIPSNAKYFRASINKNNNRPTFELFTCEGGNQALNDSINNQTNSINNINDTINDDNVDDASSEGSDFFSSFESNSHGLSGVITAPLRLVNSLTTASCIPLEFELPFVHNQVSLPCMRSIYENHFGVFFSLYQLITTGLICYSVMINLYSKIHNLQNPNNDRIEVLNL